MVIAGVNISSGHEMLHAIGVPVCCWRSLYRRRELICFLCHNYVEFAMKHKFFPVNLLV